MKKLTAKQKLALKRVGWGAFAVGTVMAARELYLALGPWRDQRRATFEQAAARASATHKQLIVLGDPEGTLSSRILGRSWQCGAICIDPKGCSQCGGPSEHSIQGQPLDVLRTMGTGSAVIYDSGLFAKADDPQALAAEMVRVSGGDIYMFDVNRFSLTSVFEPGRRRIMQALPPTDPQIAWKPLWWQKDPGAHSEALKGLGRGTRGAQGLGTVIWEYYE
jgi:hypothetical protein